MFLLKYIGVICKSLSDIINSDTMVIYKFWNFNAGLKHYLFLIILQNKWSRYLYI